MGDLVHNNFRRSKYTKFVAVNCGDVDEAISIFGNYTQQGDTPIVAMPARSSCAPYITIPQGCYAIVVKHGNFQGMWEPGFHWCMPFTKIQFLVTQQNFQFDVPVRNCPTIDNIYIQIEVSIVMRIRDGEENVKNFCYKTSVNQLNEQLDAAISERVRVLARSKTHLEAYNIKGKEHTEEMLRYMNGIFESKGVEIRSVIITNVLLDDEIADQLEEKTTYTSKNTLERKQQCFELRVINDDQEYSQKKEKMALDREAENEKFRKIKAEIEKELDKINADTEKLIAETKEQANAHVSKVIAQGELDAQEVEAETKMIRANILAEGKAKYAYVVSASEAYQINRKARIDTFVSQKESEAKRGGGGGTVAQNLTNRRAFEVQMAKLAVLKNLSMNDCMSILGENKDNLVAQMASIRMLNNFDK
jgi:regulator of protease activity HflC (stomatin/prohibitin superfamily)